MSNAKVILVNERDEAVGEIEKLAAHQQALLHRAFSVMLYRKGAQGLEFLLQQRAEDKYHCGGLWANTCCSHPRPNEDTQKAAERRLFEELGIRLPLTPIGHFTYIAHFANGLTEHEFDHVFIAAYSDTPQNFNKEEISTLKWMTAKDLSLALKTQPEQFTPWLNQVLALIQQKLT
jgi:isopentenyl-diphosphate Delta-isomerase